MRGQPGFWDLDERYERLSAVGDPLEKLNGIIRKRSFRCTLTPAISARCFRRRDGGVWFGQAAAAAFGKLNGRRSEMSASSARCGNSVRTWRNQARGSTPQARHVSMRL